MSEVKLRIPDYFPGDLANEQEIAEAARLIRSLPFGKINNAASYGRQDERGFVYLFMPHNGSYTKIFDLCNVGTKTQLIEFNGQVGVHVMKGFSPRSELDGLPETEGEEIMEGMMTGMYLTDLILESDKPDSQYYHGSFYELVDPPSAGRLRDVMDCLTNGRVILDAKHNELEDIRNFLLLKDPKIDEATIGKVISAHSAKN